MKQENVQNINRIIERFIVWLTKFGELSYDHQSFYSTPFLGKAKELYYKKPMLGIVAVAPMIFFEAFFPDGRRLFGKPMRFPIADAHYAMGFASLAEITQNEKYYGKAIHYLGELINSRVKKFKNFCWGYPFNWITRNGIVPAQTPLITTLPYVYEAFSYVYRLDRKGQWLDVMRSIADHALNDIKDAEISPGAYSCGYGPYDQKGGVVNASAYRAFLLKSAYKQFGDKSYLQAAEGNINFVLKAQLPNGSWPYAIDGVREFVDHFHTCFVLKALAKINRIETQYRLEYSIEKGIAYYRAHLIDRDLLPKPFSIAPRLTVYRRELYDYAECINLCLLLIDANAQLKEILNAVLRDFTIRWIKTDGSFRSRELIFGWDNVPMHRWAQSQMFRSLCLLIKNENLL